MIKTVIIWGFNILLLLVVLFSNDHETITVNFLHKSLTLPLGVHLVLFILLGQALALVVAWFDRADLRKQAKQLRREVEGLRKETTTLRDLAVTDSESNT